jgi:hypothetical protein
VRKSLVKFYFESFLIAFSAFLGGIVSLVINYIWIDYGTNLATKISWSIMIFVLILMSVLLILYIVISYIGRFAKE